ncbi:MAG: transglutaminase-like domain-containing protein [Thermodesulfobacteriota bacterium]
MASPIKSTDWRMWLRATYVRLWAAWLVCCLCVCPVGVFGAEREAIDWSRVAKLKPDQKVLIFIESHHPLTLQELAALADAGLAPADRDPGLVVGMSKAVFATKVNRWVKGTSFPPGLRGRLLERFFMSGIYRVSLQVEQEGYKGPLSMEVTLPREGFGRRLLKLERVLRPATRNEIHVDSAQNRWLKIAYDEISYGQTVRISVGFRYLVDMAELLRHDLMLVDPVRGASFPDAVLRFLDPGRKIDPRLPKAVEWAAQPDPEPPDARREYLRLQAFLKRTVSYDKRKREKYFGGRAVYSDMDEMYQEIPVTLNTGMGACPDTSLLECAFLRARGIPCRTAGRFGHFYTQVYVPERGWVSTSVTPTGIPLIVDPGPDHVPYQKWQPRIPLRTSLWEARVRIEPTEE